jgi:hypothetical protein
MDTDTQTIPEIELASAPAENATLERLRALIDTAEASLTEARLLLARMVPEDVPAAMSSRANALGSISQSPEGKVVEGIFDGQNMVGPDRKQYSVPANYASKSKLVEGDTLKLTITSDGSFIYKQIGPVERKRLVGTLARDEVSGEYRVLAGGKPYRVLIASITYYKGEVGDEVVVLVPKGPDARWAAVENVIKRLETEPVPIAPVSDEI